MLQQYVIILKSNKKVITKRQMIRKKDVSSYTKFIQMKSPPHETALYRQMNFRHLFSRDHALN